MSMCSNTTYMPLATRCRPRSLDSFIGQSHLTSPGKPIYRVIHQGALHSMIFWGPPGTGKTTLAELIAASVDARFERLSAVLVGVKDIREVVQRAEMDLKHNQRTVLFIDEIHRFNKAQQDAFLPHVEAGTITLIGATTENPSFALNNALLSRARVYLLHPLCDDDLKKVVLDALSNKMHGLGAKQWVLSEKLIEQLVLSSDGDARRCLTTLEVMSDMAVEQADGSFLIQDEVLRDVLQVSMKRFDKQGDVFYDLISALHKSVRGSDPDASLYWLCRMIDGGCDPLYIARRVVRMASEDIGNADPRGLQLALNAWESVERLGLPEGELALAQAVVYLACAAKSNAVYTAYKAALHEAKQSGSLEVPMHLRNAPTRLMDELGYGKGYRYAHDEPGAYAAGEVYLPLQLAGRIYYEPVDRGLEIKIREKLMALRALNHA